MNPLPFCSIDQYRYALTEPRTMPNGITYATDGRLMVFGPTADFEPFENSPGFLASNPPGNLDTLSASLLANDAGYDLDLPPGWEALPLDTQPCSHCDATGKVATCPDCHGEGEKECHECGHSEDCRRCDGTGTIKGATKQCDRCEGEGKTTKTTWIYAHHAHEGVDFYYPIQLHFLLKLRAADPAFRITAPCDSGVGILGRFPAHSTIHFALMPGRLDAQDIPSAEQQWNPTNPATA